MRISRTRITAAIAAVVTTATLVAVTPSSAHTNVLSNADIATALAGVSDKLAPTITGTSDADSIAQTDEVDIRRDGTVHFRTPDAGDIVITLPFATQAEATNGGVTYRSANSATVTRPTQGGAQTLLVAANKSAPTDYPFGVSNGYVASLPDGGLLLLDRNHKPFRVIAAPWARDAAKQKVDTSYTVNAEGTAFMQSVAHNVDGVVYPVVADPIMVWLVFFTVTCWVGGSLAWGLSRDAPFWLRIGGVLWACFR